MGGREWTQHIRAPSRSTPAACKLGVIAVNRAHASLRSTGSVDLASVSRCATIGTFAPVRCRANFPILMLLLSVRHSSFARDREEVVPRSSSSVNLAKAGWVPAPTSGAATAASNSSTICSDSRPDDAG